MNDQLMINYINIANHFIANSLITTETVLAKAFISPKFSTEKIPGYIYIVGVLPNSERISEIHKIFQMSN